MTVWQVNIGNAAFHMTGSQVYLNQGKPDTSEVGAFLRLCSIVRSIQGHVSFLLISITQCHLGHIQINRLSIFLEKSFCHKHTVYLGCAHMLHDYIIHVQHYPHWKLEWGPHQIRRFPIRPRRLWGPNFYCPSDRPAWTGGHFQVDICE